MSRRWNNKPDQSLRHVWRCRFQLRYFLSVMRKSRKDWVKLSCSHKKEPRKVFHARSLAMSAWLKYPKRNMWRMLTISEPQRSQPRQINLRTSLNTEQIFGLLSFFAVGKTAIGRNERKCLIFFAINIHVGWDCSRSLAVYLNSSSGKWNMVTGRDSKWAYTAFRALKGNAGCTFITELIPGLHQSSHFLRLPIWVWSILLLLFPEARDRKLPRLRMFVGGCLWQTSSNDLFHCRDGLLPLLAKLYTVRNEPPSRTMLAITLWKICPDRVRCPHTMDLLSLRIVCWNMSSSTRLVLTRENHHVLMLCNDPTSSLSAANSQQKRWIENWFSR